MMNAPGCLIALALSLVPPLYLNAVRLAWRYDPTPVAEQDFACVSDTAEALSLLRDCAAAGRAVRVVGSGWSSSPVVWAGPNSSNVRLCGALRRLVRLDAPGRAAFVGAGMMLSELVAVLADEEARRPAEPPLEWAPRGFCYLPRESQTFGGFIANNAHHSYTPTAYHHVEFVEVATFVRGEPAVVNASRASHAELFESLFGGVGFTGILLRVGLRLRVAALHDVDKLDGALTSANFARVARSVLDRPSMVDLIPCRGFYQTTAYGDAGEAAPAAQRPRATAEYDRGWLGRHAGALEAFTYDLAALRLSGYDEGRRVDWRMRAFHLYHLHFSPVPRRGRSLRAERAMAFHLGRGPLFPLTNASVAMLDWTLLSASLFVPAERVDDLIGILRRVAYADDGRPDGGGNEGGNGGGDVGGDVGGRCRLAAHIGVRWVSRAGGIVASNAAGDRVAFDIVAAPDTVSAASFEALLRLVAEAEVPVQMHTGKFVHLPTGRAWAVHDAMRSALAPERRQRFAAAIRAHDPSGVFDGGQIRAAELFGL